MKTLTAKVKPNSKQQSIRYEDDGSLTMQLKALPINGKANQALIRLLAKTLGILKAAIRLKTGSASQLKRIEIGA